MVKHPKKKKLNRTKMMVSKYLKSRRDKIKAADNALLNYINSTPKTRTISVDATLINHINSYYVRQTTLEKKVAKEASGTLEYKQLQNGDRYLYDISNIDESKIEHHFFVPIKPSNYNWHTHPLQANIENKSSLSWPSGLDFVYLLENYTVVNTHFVFTADGVYTMQITPKFLKFLHIFRNNINIFRILSKNILNMFASVESERVKANPIFFDFIEMDDLKMNKSNTTISIKDVDTRNLILNAIRAKNPSNLEAQRVILDFKSMPTNKFLEYANSRQLKSILNEFQVVINATDQQTCLRVFNTFQNIKLFNVKLFLSGNINLVTTEVKFPSVVKVI